PGIIRDTTRGLLLRLDGDVLAFKPAGDVLLIGTNDLEEGAEPEVIAANLRLLLSGLQKHNAKLPVVLCAVLPSYETKKRP
ncbi:GDSL-type esterase/lipase family protein, partial [Pseudomonas syringae group genomosp. 7]|uniref:GDSL-type esterase/lipase family protein n=1 Tax=Pseudomonas syringae group genomosp. 7 TaxID=251699 RepID=UPI0037702EFE